MDKEYGSRKPRCYRSLHVGVSKERVMKSMRYTRSMSNRRTDMKKALLAAIALVLAAPATSALAHDTGSYESFFNHLYDHQEHQGFHQEFNAEHGAAHWQGFANPQQHEDWHRAYGATHGQFHQDHPGTGHDHYGYGSYGYHPYIGYQHYGYGGWYGGY